MPKFYLVLLTALFTAGAWGLYQYGDHLEQFVEEHFSEDSSSYLALQGSYSLEQLEAQQRAALTARDRNAELESTLILYPYLLVDAVYQNPEQRNREVVLLWSQQSGEIVLDLDQWQVSSGMAKLITSQATADDYKVIAALAAAGGRARRDQLLQTLGTSHTPALERIASAQNKGLIAVEGNQYQLREPYPALNGKFKTRINQRLQTKLYTMAKRQPPQFSKEQIVAAAKSLLPPNTVLRDVKEIYIPVYAISVEGANHRVNTTYWNTLNGKPFTP